MPAVSWRQKIAQNKLVFWNVPAVHAGAPAGVGFQGINQLAVVNKFNFNYRRFAVGCRAECYFWCFVQWLSFGSQSLKL